MSAWDDFKNWIGQTASDAGDKVFPDADTTAGGWVQAADEKYRAVTDATNRAISAGWLMTNPMQSNTFLQPSEAWNQAEDISAGQSYASNPLSLLDPVSLLTNQTAKQQLISLLPGQEDFRVDVTDERVRKATFEDSLSGKLSSGVVDFGIMWYTDPLVVGGKAIKVGRAAATLRPVKTIDDQRLAAQEIVEHQAWLDTNGVQGRRTGWGQLVEDLTRGDAVQNSMHRALRRSNSLSALAHLTGEAKDFHETALIVRAALKDENAISYLREYRASTADALDMWRGLVAPDALQMQNAAGAMSFAGTNPSFGRYVGQRALDMMATTVDDQEKYSRVLTDLVARDKYLRKFEDNLVAQGTDFGREVGASKFASWEARRGQSARTRAQNFFGDTEAVINETVFQRNPMVRAVRYFTWHPLHERQSGWVSFAGANMVDAHKEIMAAVDQVPVYTRWSKSADPALRQKAALAKNDIMKRWFAASDDYSRQNAVKLIEQRVLADMADHYSIPKETMDELMNLYSAKRSSTIKQMHEQGFAVDPVDGSMIRSPQMVSQLPEKTPIMDFGVMDKTIRQNLTTLSMPRKIATGVEKNVLDPVSAVVDSFYAVWRPATLLRLGYTQRNVFEGNLRALVAYGFVPSLVDPWGTLGRFSRNRANDIRWSSNRFGAWASGDARRLKEEIEASKDALTTARETAHQRRLTMESQIGSYVSPTDHLHDFMLNKMNRNQFIMRERRAARAAERQAQQTGVAVTDRRMRRAIQLNNQYANGQITLQELKRLMLRNAQRDIPGNLRQLRGSLSAAEKAAKVAERRLSAASVARADRMPGRIRSQRYGMELGGVFDGPAGRAALANSSAGKTTQSMIADPAAEALNRHTNEVAKWTKINPIDDSGITPVLNKEYFPQLLSVTERQVKGDTVAKMILDGRSDAEILAWINSKDDLLAREWRNSMKKAGVNTGDASDHVADLRRTLEYYYPTPEIRRAVLEQSLTAKQLQNFYAGIEMDRLPVIHGRVSEKQLIESGIPQLMYGGRVVTQKLYQILGTAPEDILVRHRFYAKIYENEVKRLQYIDAQNIRSSVNPLTKAEADSRLLSIQRSAHRTALKATRETLYTIERESNLTAALRWVSPFFAAQENTLRVWAGFAVKDPSMVARAQMIYDAPNRAHMVFDADGNEIPAASLPLSDIGRDQYLSFNPNDEFSQMLFGGARATVSKQSMNVVLQGQNFITPGFGPPVGMAAQMFYRDNPDKLADLKGTPIGNMVANAILPFGTVQTDETWKMVLPAWIDKVATLIQKDGSKEYQNFYMMQSVALQVDIENGVLPPSQVPQTKDQFDSMVADRTRHAYMMRAVANLTLPFAISMDSKYEFYVNEYRKLQKSEPDQASAFAKFTDKYPDFWAVTASLSKNPSGMAPTITAFERYKANETLVSNVAHDYPDLVGLITNPVGMSTAPFDQGVYAWQYDRKIMDSDPTIKFRDIQSVQDAIKDARAQVGWKEFNIAKTMLDAQLQSSGIASIQSAPQEVRDAWKEIVDGLKNDYPEWAEQKYSITAPSEVSRKIDAIRGIVEDPKFIAQNKSDPMWDIARNYLLDREIFLDALKENDDPDMRTVIRETWAEVSQQYTDSNSSFATFYNRWLDYDPEVLP